MFLKIMMVLNLITKILFNIFFLPGLFLLLWLMGIILLKTLLYGLLFCITFFVILPLIFKLCPHIQRTLLFLDIVRHPDNARLQRLEEFELYGVRNFYLNHTDETTKKEVTLGCWHVLPIQLVDLFAKELNIDKEKLNVTSKNQVDLPKNLKSSLRFNEFQDKNKFFEELLSTTNFPVILYFHGNSFTRCAAHRVDLYKLLQSINFHVIAFDYRNFGDSSHVKPTEKGVVNDALCVYTYLTKLTKNPIFIWGHSLGTAIGCHAASLIQKSILPQPRGIILESPFTNIGDEITYYPMAAPFRRLPWFNYSFIDALHKNDFYFESDIHVGVFRAPILILHAEDDIIVPIKLGKKLYEIALHRRKDKSWGPVQFHKFPASNGFGHKYICRSNLLPDLVTNFVNKFIDKTY